MSTAYKLAEEWTEKVMKDEVLKKELQVEHAIYEKHCLEREMGVNVPFEIFVSSRFLGVNRNLVREHLLGK